MREEWLDRLERKLEFLHFPGLPFFLATLSAFVGLLSWIKPEFPRLLILDPAALLSGELWRALTFLFVPPDTAPIWLLLWLVLYYAMLEAMERLWGPGRLTLYTLAGAAASTLGALAAGWPSTNGLFVASLFFAFARLSPRFEILVFFLFPVQLKWLARLGWGLAGFELLLAPLPRKAELVLGLAHYGVFFGHEHLRELGWAWRRWRRPR